LRSWRDGLIAGAGWLFDDIGEREEFLERMHDRAQAFVADPLRWRQISAVGTQLIRLHELDRQPVQQIMDEIVTLHPH
jgi:hypothetical protein